MPETAPITPRKLPKQDRSRATVEAILEATTRILCEEGRERLTTNRVARVAGVSVGSLYQYFPNKASLLDEVRDRYERDFTERMVRALSRIGTLPLREAVREFMRFMVEVHAEQPRLHRELGSEVPDPQRRYLYEFARAYLEAHRDEVRPKDIELATYIVLEAGEALIHGTALREPGRLADERFAEEVCDLLLRYLAE